MSAESIFTFQLFSGIEELKQARSCWEKVLTQSACPHFLHLYSWYASWIESLSEAEQSEVSFYMAFQNNKPVAVFPLKQRTAGWEIPDVADVMMQDFSVIDNCSVPKLLKCLCLELSKNSSWNYLAVTGAPESSSMMRGVHSKKLLTTSIYHHDSSILNCVGSYEQFMSEFSSSHRKKLLKKERKLKGQGNFQIRILESKPDLESGLNAFLDLEAKGWKGGEGSGTAIKFSKMDRSFYEKLIDNAPDGTASINLLYLDQKCIAGQLCLSSGGTLYLLKISYDPDYRKWSPGHVLLRTVIEKCCQLDGIQKINFVSSAPWHDFWHPGKERVYEVVIYNRSLKGFLLFLKAWVGNNLREIKRVYAGE